MSKSHVDLNEVELVDAVKECRDCQWFWGATPPYGPFPSHDWRETYPVEIRNGPQPSNPNTDPILWAKVELTGQKLVEPAVLKGCRKAPIMTVGINPNMTAYFAGSKAAQWSYPWFSESATYAYYYRYASIYQESFSLDTIKEAAIDGTQIMAPINGTVVVSRSSSHRWMQFAFFNEQDKDNPEMVIERAWQPDERLVVVIFNKRKESTESPFAESIASAKPKNHIDVKQGELVALQIAPTAQSDVDLYANRTGYYERFLEPLGRFNNYLKADFPNINLAMGEDVSMHDLVGCASPGWSAGYDIPRERIAHNCVDKNQYLMDQVKQSRPKLIIVVSDSSLKMLNEGVKAAGGVIELDFEGVDIYTLLEETTKRVHNLKLPLANGETIVSRIITTPHFSYPDNFKDQSRFTDDAWALFSEQFPEIVKLLDKEERLNSLAGSGYVSVHIKTDDDLKDEITHAAWRVLMDYHFQPYELMFEALLDQHEREPFITDKSAAHLGRDPANCFFCDNKQWQFPGGCDYK